MQSSLHEFGRSNLKLKVKDFQTYDRRNFVKACNNVCYFENDDVQIYFSIVDVGFFFKEYLLFGLKLKKKAALYELVIAESLTADGPLLPLRDMSSFSKIRRFNQKQKITGKDKRITLTFEDQETWKLIFKNRDMYYDWMDLLKLAWTEEPLSKSFICKQLKRNYEYMIWRTQNPEARSCHFGEPLDISATFRQEMVQTKDYVGVNTDEIIGRLICEKRDKLRMKKKVQESQRLNYNYQRILSQIDRSITTGIDA